MLSRSPGVEAEQQDRGPADKNGWGVMLLPRIVLGEFARDFMTHRIHGAGIYANMTGVY